jgi:hypothetical protein
VARGSRARRRDDVTTRRRTRYQPTRAKPPDCGKIGLSRRTTSDSFPLISAVTPVIIGRTRSVVKRQTRSDVAEVTLTGRARHDIIETGLCRALCNRRSRRVRSAVPPGAVGDGSARSPRAEPAPSFPWSDVRVGLRSTTGNRVKVNAFRGFESLSLRICARLVAVQRGEFGRRPSSAPFPHLRTRL